MPEFRALYEEYLDRFGDRCLEELKLESPTLFDDPLTLIRSVGQLARRLAEGGVRPPASQEAEIRQAAEMRVRPEFVNPVRCLMHAQASVTVPANQRRPPEDKSQPNYSPVVSDRRKASILALSSADASPPYGFILLPGTISSGLAMKRFSFASSQMKSALFIALE